MVKEGSLLPLVTGDHDWASRHNFSVNKASLDIRMSGKWPGNRAFSLTSLCWLPVLQSLALPRWRTGFCHLSCVVSILVPVTAHVGVEDT